MGGHYAVERCHVVASLPYKLFDIVIASFIFAHTSFLPHWVAVVKCENRHNRYKAIPPGKIPKDSEKNQNEGLDSAEWEG